MTIQEFCIRHGLRLTKTARLIRRAVHSKARSDHPDVDDVREIGFDYDFKDIGLRASKQKLHTRIRYAVTDSALLLAFVRKTLRYDVLTDRDLATLTDAASFLADIVAGRTEWFLVDKHGVAFAPRREYFSELERAVRKAGDA